MQATTVSPTPAPAPPAAQAPLSITFTDVDGTTHNLPVPLTEQAVRSLKSERNELSNQLNSASDRRQRIAEELKSAPSGASRAGLEQRLAVLDKRIVQLESDIAATGQQLSAAPSAIAETRVPDTGGDMPDNVAAITATFIIFVLFPIAFSMSRWIWKRTNRAPAPSAQLAPQVDQRLERLEQGVDAIAIEVERITEGQRFVTRLLSEQQSREQLPASQTS